MTYKVIADSACDLKRDYFEKEYNDSEIGFEVVPFVITINGKDYVDDDEHEYAEEILAALEDKKSGSATSCPSPFAYEEACSAENNFIVTISSKLSGSYNSALSASNSVDKKIFVIDSMGTGGMEELVVDKLHELCKRGLTFEEIKKQIIEYRDSLNLYFSLANFDNLVKKGRIKAGLAKLIQAIKIRLLCKATEGEIALHKTCLSVKQVFITTVTEVKKILGEETRHKCVITYVDNLEEVMELQGRLLKTELFDEVVLRKSRGLDTYYSLSKGMVVSF